MIRPVRRMSPMMTREARCQKYFESKSSAFKICRGFRSTLDGVSAMVVRG